MEIKVPVIDQSHLGAKGFFFVGGAYKGPQGNSHMNGQMFIEVYVPKEVKRPYPIIMFHGAGQTNLNWLGTPDGRMGWCDWFVEQGYVVYLAEQPARGRSAYHPDEDGPRRYHAVEDIESRFVGSNGKWPSAHLHTQWPETALHPGQEQFDQFASQQVEFIGSNQKTQEMVFAAARELLEKTGPAILVTHSQSGPFGWKIADAYPERVKAVVALEPSGPPFGVRGDDGVAKSYALCDIPMDLQPPVASPEEFKLKKVSSPREEERPGWVLADGSPYRLPGLARVPVLLMTAEASYHTQFDYLVSQVLDQLGVKHDFVRLGDIGIHGNSHFMMIEKNNLEIAQLVEKWLGEHT